MPFRGCRSFSPPDRPTCYYPQAGGKTVFGCSLTPVFKFIRKVDDHICQTAPCRRWTPEQYQEAEDTLTLMRDQFNRLINDLDTARSQEVRRTRVRNSKL